MLAAVWPHGSARRRVLASRPTPPTLPHPSTPVLPCTSTKRALFGHPDPPPTAGTRSAGSASGSARDGPPPPGRVVGAQPPLVAERLARRFSHTAARQPDGEPRDWPGAEPCPTAPPSAPTPPPAPEALGPGRRMKSTGPTRPGVPTLAATHGAQPPRRLLHTPEDVPPRHHVRRLARGRAPRAARRGRQNSLRFEPSPSVPTPRPPAGHPDATWNPRRRETYLALETTPVRQLEPAPNAGSPHHRSRPGPSLSTRRTPAPEIPDTDLGFVLAPPLPFHPLPAAPHPGSPRAWALAIVSQASREAHAATPPPKHLPRVKAAVAAGLRLPCCLARRPAIPLDSGPG